MFQFNDFKNEHFSVANAETKIDDALQLIAQDASRYGFSYSDEDLEEINLAHQRIKEKTDQYFEIIKTQFNFRRTYLNKFAHLKFISLGTDCFSRTFPTRWGLKPSAKLGEETHPFDIAVHPLPTIINLINNDFDDYLSVENLMFDEKHNTCYNKKIHIHFNHETGKQFADNNFQLLIEKYIPRIDNFRRALTSSNKAVFILHIHNANDHDIKCIELLWQALLPWRENKASIFIAINTLSYDETMCRAEEIHTENGNIKIFNINYPTRNYVWHANALSIQGFEFEKKIFSFMLTCIEEWDKNVD